MGAFLAARGHKCCATFLPYLPAASQCPCAAAAFLCRRAQLRAPRDLIKQITPPQVLESSSQGDTNSAGGTRSSALPLSSAAFQAAVALKQRVQLLYGCIPPHQCSSVSTLGAVISLPWVLGCRAVTDRAGVLCAVPHQCPLTCAPVSFPEHQVLTQDFFN